MAARSGREVHEVADWEGARCQTSGVGEMVCSSVAGDALGSQDSAARVVSIVVCLGTFLTPLAGGVTSQTCTHTCIDTAAVAMDTLPKITRSDRVFGYGLGYYKSVL